MKKIQLYDLRWNIVSLFPMKPDGNVYELYDITDCFYLYFKGVQWRGGRNHI